MTTSPSSSAQDARRALGLRLRDLRTRSGLTIRELSAGLSGGKHYTRISKIENGRQLPTARDISEWCRLTGATDHEQDLLATLRAVDSAYIEHRRESRAGMKRVLGAHTPQRYRATRVFRMYEHNVIPGLFQTPEYARAMLRFWVRFLNTPNDIDEAVAVRMERQQIVQRGGRRFVIVLEEQALRTWFGTAEVQAGQLGRLLEVMSLPQVSLGIIPLMRERGGVGSTGFWIFDDELVALETPSASIQVTQPAEVSLYARMFEELKRSAVYGREARQLIVNVLEELDQ
ncbi:helix-turn-helix domain-containing protein [Nocardia cyriacigeorgica]|uniref:helix-turn-helix domain-containing protein n=1 Tax=Nocardia cyriacigeorgica TaxID=135487 RepID=UPI00189523B9|nr:helix-turn-helix transcriptional regulator [Nocardia cyriacigeorgica]MBF6438029.1 helix-turn-helix transcriptional regulator [Nocardia cyriacigeorgica]